MRIGCWLPQAIDAHREYAIIAFPMQQRLRESASMIRYIISCLVGIIELISCLVGITELFSCPVGIIELIPKLGGGMFSSNKFIDGAGGT
jgi:hypothetical protein